MMGDTYVPRFWPPFLTLWVPNSIFFLIHQHKNDLLGTNPRKIRSFWPQNTIFPLIFLGPIFSGPRHTPSNFRTEYPPPPPPGLFYTTSSFVHHFKSISEFKLELQSGNAQIGSKWTIFLSCVTLKFDWWPCKTIGHLFYATSSFVYHFILIGEFKFELQSGNALFGSKSTIFLAVWPWNLTDDPQKQ